MELREIYRVLESARQDQGLSQNDVGQLAFGRPDNSAMQNIRRGNSPSIEKLSALANALGLEMYFGPPRLRDVGAEKLEFSDEYAPLVGFARCSIDGWYDDENERDPVVRPAWITDRSAFWVNAKGQSMFPEGIQAGDFCIVSPSREAQIGDRVFVKEAGTGKASIKRLTSRQAGKIILRGWMPPQNGSQKEFIEERPAEGVAALYPVVAVYRGTPGKSGVDVQYIPDPRASRHDDLEVIETLTDARKRGARNLAPDVIGLPGAWVRRHTKGRGRIVSVNMSDDAMAPLIPKGALVLGTSSEIAIEPKAIYIIRLNGEVLVRRLEQFSDGAVLVLGDNASARTTFLPAGRQDTLEVLASVIWVGSER